jgi:hypothetical protein
MTCVADIRHPGLGLEEFRTIGGGDQDEYRLVWTERNAKALRRWQTRSCHSFTPPHVSRIHYPTIIGLSTQNAPLVAYAYTSKIRSAGEGAMMILLSSVDSQWLPYGTTWALLRG